VRVAEAKPPQVRVLRLQPRDALIHFVDGWGDRSIVAGAGAVWAAHAIDAVELEPRAELDEGRAVPGERVHHAAKVRRQVHVVVVKIGVDAPLGARRQPIALGTERETRLDERARCLRLQAGATCGERSMREVAAASGQILRRFALKASSASFSFIASSALAFASCRSFSSPPLLSCAMSAPLALRTNFLASYARR